MTSCHGDSSSSLRLLTTTSSMKARTSGSGGRGGGDLKCLSFRNGVAIAWDVHPAGSISPAGALFCIFVWCPGNCTTFSISELSFSFYATQHLQRHAIPLVLCPMPLLSDDRNCVGCRKRKESLIHGYEAGSIKKKKSCKLLLVSAADLAT
jgi:hypothetical protein